MYALCEGYNSGFNRLSLIKFKNGLNGSITKDWEYDISVNIVDAVQAADGKPCLIELDNGNLYIIFIFDTGTDQIRFVELNYLDGSIVNNCYLVGLSNVKDLNFRISISPNETKAIFCCDMNHTVCFDISDRSAVEKLWQISSDYYTAVDPLVYFEPLASSWYGDRLFLFGRNVYEYEGLSSWFMIEADPDTGANIGDYVKIGTDAGVFDSEAWYGKPNDDFDGSFMRKALGI
jgi:hypothetical protein